VKHNDNYNLIPEPSGVTTCIFFLIDDGWYGTRNAGI